MILGIDEAGRGPWAGPLVVGAAVLGGVQIEGLTDSKKLTKKKRESLYDIIREQAAAYATGWVSAADLDEIGMSEALRLATRRAVEQIKVPYTEIIIDGMVNFLAGTGKGAFVQTMKKADLLVPSVSAASILAKVERDRFMAEQDAMYPGYGFGGHAGYGVAKHRAAIEKLGVTPLHRLSFAPLQKYRTVTPVSTTSPRNTRLFDTTKAIGDKAENVVAQYLESQNHAILARNWKTKICEIDIVSQLDDTMYFTEVKYRKNDDHGSGMAAITPKKLHQMNRAAEYFALKHAGDTMDLLLAVADVAGLEFELKEWITLQR
ncbi:MAG TPA: ribonuclease HII [Candidatus Saccharibacteria bacterium]|nr:ribonuclease HII [Candidatus Saccharibacteria bacterium]HMR38224.1 ribonuclease HII [Candidatus Saccharibacteria bacterium]